MKFIFIAVILTLIGGVLFGIVAPAPISAFALKYYYVVYGLIVTLTIAVGILLGKGQIQMERGSKL